jgi:hypothetical protein
VRTYLSVSDIRPSNPTRKKIFFTLFLSILDLTGSLLPHK